MRAPNNKWHLLSISRNFHDRITFFEACRRSKWLPDWLFENSKVAKCFEILFNEDLAPFSFLFMLSGIDLYSFFDHSLVKYFKVSLITLKVYPFSHTMWCCLGTRKCAYMLNSLDSSFFPALPPLHSEVNIKKISPF